jgi:hypothetical protein
MPDPQIDPEFLDPYLINNVIPAPAQRIGDENFEIANRLQATLTDEYGKIDETLVRVAEGVFSPGWFVGEHVTEYNPLISYHFRKVENQVTEVRFVAANEPEVVLKPVIAANHP